MKTEEEVENRIKAIRERGVYIFPRKEPETTVPTKLIRDISINITARFLYIVYASFADSHWNFTFVAQKKIANIMLKERQMITKYVKELREEGWITVIRRGQGKANIVILHRRKGEIISDKNKKAYIAEVERRINEKFLMYNPQYI